jgi:hypothetical protein
MKWIEERDRSDFGRRPYASELDVAFLGSDRMSAASGGNTKVQATIVNYTYNYTHLTGLGGPGLTSSDHMSITGVVLDSSQWGMTVPPFERHGCDNRHAYLLRCLKSLLKLPENFKLGGGMFPRRLAVECLQSL